MLYCYHLRDCYDNHTHNIHIAFPPVSIIPFIIGVFYKASVKGKQNESRNDQGFKCAIYGANWHLVTQGGICSD